VSGPTAPLAHLQPGRLSSGELRAQPENAAQFRPSARRQLGEQEFTPSEHRSDAFVRRDLVTPS
jgi:hypothetical protein